MTSPNLSKTKKIIKVLFLSKINPVKNESIKENIKEIFENPNTYFNLSNESPNKYIIGKKIQGPRYDKNNKLIPYSIVGKIYQNKTKSISIFEKRLSASIIKKSFSNYFKKFSFHRKNTFNYEDNQFNNQLKTIFSKFDDSIKKNEKKEINSFLKNIPNDLNDTVKKHLILQEQSFINQNKINSYRKNLKKKIKEKIKDTNRVLLLSLSDSYREKKELNEFLDKSDNHNYQYNSQNWIINLRKPINYKGINKGFINNGNKSNPLWSSYIKKSDKIYEKIRKPYTPDYNKTYKNTLIKNDSFLNNNSKLKNYINRCININQLEVNGKKLLDFEKKNAKLLKGRKKLVQLKYDKESTKDLSLIDNWKYKGSNTII